MPDAPLPVPTHVAIIMDGNGRWATAQNLPRAAGHRAGAEALRQIVARASTLKVPVLTVYSFSTENWLRGEDEVGALMGLYVEYLHSQRDLLMEHDVRLMQIGNRDQLPSDVRKSLEATMQLTESNAGTKLVLALNYGSRAEMTHAVRALAVKVKEGSLDPGDINDAAMDAHLDTAVLGEAADPDLLIRTAGEMRLSNYLLWQCAYTELYVTDTLWPDFTPECFDAALADYARRTRKFGAVVVD